MNFFLIMHQIFRNRKIYSFRCIKMNCNPDSLQADYVLLTDIGSGKPNPDLLKATFESSKFTSG